MWKRRSGHKPNRKAWLQDFRRSAPILTVSKIWLQVVWFWWKATRVTVKSSHVAIFVRTRFWRDQFLQLDVIVSASYSRRFSRCLGWRPTSRSKLGARMILILDLFDLVENANAAAMEHAGQNPDKLDCLEWIKAYNNWTDVVCLLVSFSFLLSFSKNYTQLPQQLSCENNRY